MRGTPWQEAVPSFEEQYCGTESSAVTVDHTPEMFGMKKKREGEDKA